MGQIIQNVVDRLDISGRHAHEKELQKMVVQELLTTLLQPKAQDRTTARQLVSSRAIKIIFASLIELFILSATCQFS